MIQLTCKIGTSDIRIVEVEITEPLSVLKERLNIYDKKTKFIFKGVTYMIDTNLTFKDIGLTSNSSIFINNPAISGTKKNMDNIK